MNDAHLVLSSEKLNGYRMTKGTLSLEQSADFCNVHRGVNSSTPVSPERIGIFRCDFYPLVGELKQISCGVLGIVK